MDKVIYWVLTMIMAAVFWGAAFLNEVG